MKKMLTMVIALGLMLIPVSAVIAGGDQNQGDKGTGSTYENGCVEQPCFENAPKPGSSVVLTTQAVASTAALDETEIDHLVFIREEEKLARDVYLSLYQKWGNPVFAKIAESEQAHMDAMANLLSFYGIDDPVTNDVIGAYTNQDIGDLFQDLINWGLLSEKDALLVGGYIEEYDILDIWKAYEETDEVRIQRVYQNLYEGSYNHLDAFVYNYELLTGESYVSQLLSKTQYDLVMAFVTQAKQSQNPKQQQGK